ncbi:MAG: amidohydrolase family protein [Thermoleophilia bacterium]
MGRSLTRLLVGCVAAAGGTPGLPERFSLRLEEGAITGIGDLQQRPGEEVVDLAGAFLVPGLVDSHVHLALGAAAAQGAVSAAGLHLEAGVTAVRDLGGGVRCAGEGRCADEDRLTSGSGGIRGPRIVSSGGSFTRRGRYGSFLGTALDPGDDLAAAVRGRAETGAEVIKVILTGSVDFERGFADPPHFSFAELRQAIEAAHSLGIPVAVHANGGEAIRMAAEAGADSVEHGILCDEAALEALATCECVWVPTLTPLYALAASGHGRSLPRVMAAHEEMVRRGHEAGVRIAAGTDAGSPGVPHGSLLVEITVLRRAGLSPAAAREAAVAVGAELLGLPEGYGRLAVGAVTDLVWFESDPFDRISPEAATGIRPVGVLRT